MARRMVMLPALLSATAALSGCRTVLIESHRLPAESKLAFERTLVIVDVPEQLGSEKARRAAESELAGRLVALNASPSFQLIAAEDLGDLGQMKKWAAQEGFDGLVVVWLESIVTTQFPSLPAAEGFDEVPARDLFTLRVSASVVSLKEDREVWTGVVRQFDPYPLTKRLPAVARVVARKLKSEGLAD